MDKNDEHDAHYLTNRAEVAFSSNSKSCQVEYAREG